MPREKQGEERVSRGLVGMQEVTVINSGRVALLTTRCRRFFVLSWAEAGNMKTIKR